MGKVFISLGGGGGVGSDELTATKADVLAGKSFVGSDTNDEIGTGTMVDKSGTTQEATATLDSSNKRVQLAVPATGKYDTNAKLYAAYATLASLLGVEAAKMLTTETILGVQGTIVDRGIGAQAVSSGKNDYGVYYYLNSGYYPTDQYGNPWVYRPLSDFGGVPANKVVSGQTFTSTAGLKVTGTMAVTSAINFSATALSATSIRISWTNPSKGPWEGVFIQMSTSGNPGVSGGTRVYTGRGNSTTPGGSNYVDITGLSLGTTYYFTCTSYVNNLGNGSSYNVSAKTSGMILWDGSNLQSGCTWEHNGYRFDLTMTAGTLNNKTLIFIPKKNLTEYWLAPRCFNSNSSLSECYLKSDGTVNDLPKNAWSSWVAGTKYTFNGSHIWGSSTCVRFRFGIGSRNAGDTSLSGCVSLIALV